MKALALAALIACGSPQPPPEDYDPSPRPESKIATFNPAAHYETTSEDVSFGNVPGTLVRPARPGKFPGIVLFAGSGPTDRDWNSPLIATKNGSGKLLATALASKGLVVLRFDKVGTGANKESLPTAKLDTYVAEMRGALEYLRSRREVEANKLFIAGHSEGGIHAMRTALVEGDHIAGVMLLSASGRTMEDIMVAQITAQVEDKAPGKSGAIVGPFKKALDDFAGGATIDPKTATPIPGLQVLLASLTAVPELGRGLLTFDPLAAIAKIKVPIFIYNGEHDIQVDPTLDAKALLAAAQATNKDVTEFLAPEADHVLKHETRAIPELRKDIAGTAEGYNAPDRMLDANTVNAIVSWLSSH